MSTAKATIMVIAITAIAMACQKQADSGAMTLKMTDAPAEWTAVNVDIRQIEVRYSDPKTDVGNWIGLQTKAGIYNLLELQNGVTTILVNDQELPAGKVEEIRLILGPANSLVIGDIEYSLKVPSGQSSGIKIKLGALIHPDQTTVVLIDFDAEKSVVQEGNGTYLLKPVIKVESIIQI